MRGPELHWLPRQATWSQALADVTPGADAWPALCALARTRIDALQTRTLDRRRRTLVPDPPPHLGTPPIRLGVLASSTVDHLLPGIRVGGMRRDIWIETHTPDYGQYAQALMDPASSLHAFQPDAVLFALDAHHLLSGIAPGGDAAETEAQLDRIAGDLSARWAHARQTFRCQVIQQTLLPVFAPLLGDNEHRLPGSPYWAVQQLNAMLRMRADAEGVDLLALDMRAAIDGLSAWYDPALWHRAKQEVHPFASTVHGDLVARLLAAARGRSAKALVPGPRQHAVGRRDRR